MTHITDNEALLLDYLYDEAEPAERLRISRHLQECAPCSVAVLELQSVRGLLREWAPPEAALGFKVVSANGSAEAPVLPARVHARFGSGWPAWMQAAAAVVLFGAGMAVSQLHVEYADGALTFRARPTAAIPIAAAEPVTHSGTDIPLPPSVTAGSPSIAAENVGYSPARPMSNDDLMRQVQALIDRSETRQQRELALRLADVVRDFDTQRQADLIQVQQNLGQIEGQTGEAMAQQRALLNSLVKTVSQGGIK